MTTVLDNAFPIETETVTTVSYSYTDPDVPTATELSTFITTMTYTSDVVSHIVVTPTCVLPSIVPQCQSQWDSYYSQALQGPTALQGSTTPACTQASVDPSSCSVLRTAYVDGEIAPSVSIPSTVPGDYYYTTSGGYIGYYPRSFSSLTVSTWSWPASRSLAPGCTV